MECPVCSQDAPLRLTGSAEIMIGTVAVALEARPVVACDENHGATPRTVVDAAMRAVEEQVATARARLLRRDACCWCGTPLTMPVRRTERPVTVASTDEQPTLTMLFDLPATRCPECSSDQVPSASHEDLVVAVPALFARDGG